MNNDIASNLQKISSRIEKTCTRCKRDPAEVKLLLATKTVSARRIKEALLAGQTLIAENKVQELKEKFESLQDIPHTDHFIGHLQSNKIKDILKYGVSCIQSLDRLSLAEKLQQRLDLEDRSMEVFIQVNTSNEDSKYGVHPALAIELVKEIAKFPRVQVKGLMTIGLFSGEAVKVRRCFRLLKSIQQEILALNIPGVEMNELSMGMSNDFEIAIEEGATMVRVGTAVFGRRKYPDSYYWSG